MKRMIPAEEIEARIFVVRGVKVMFDRDLAGIYGVPTRRLNEQVKRNRKRFPGDFMFQLNGEETADWMSQIAISNPGARMGIRKRPYAFTEQGVAMLSGVLNSERAVLVHVEIMRAFVRLKRMPGADRDLARRLDELERKYDARFKAVFDAIRGLMEPPARSRPVIGFRPETAEGKREARKGGVGGGHNL